MSRRSWGALLALTVGLGGLTLGCPQTPQTGVISGVVTDSAGQPIGSAELETVPLAGSAVTAADGTYALTVAPATYTVKVSKSGYVAAEKPDVTVSAGGSALVDFSLVAVVTTGALAGTVTDATDGHALVGAVVTTTPATSTASTNASGAFSIPGVPAGTYQLHVALDGYVSAQVNGVVVGAGATCTQNLQLAPAVTYANTCEECHLQSELLLADLAANPPPTTGESGSTGEG